MNDYSYVLWGVYVKNIERSVELLKVLADSTRFRILDQLIHKTMCVKEIAKELNATQSAISHQLRILKEYNLVKANRHGKQVFYSLGDEHVRNIIELVIVHVGHN